MGLLAHAVPRAGQQGEFGAGDAFGHPLTRRGGHVVVVCALPDASWTGQSGQQVGPVACANEVVLHVGVGSLPERLPEVGEHLLLLLWVERGVRLSVGLGLVRRDEREHPLGVVADQPGDRLATPAQRLLLHTNPWSGAPRGAAGATRATAVTRFSSSTPQATAYGPPPEPPETEHRSTPSASS